MEWREVAVTVSSSGEEAVADLFYQLGCPGVSVEDPGLIKSYIESGRWDYHTFGEVDLSGLSVVKGYFLEDAELPGKLQMLDTGLAVLAGQNPGWQMRSKGATVVEKDWATAWKAYFKPVRVGKHFLIKPSWEEIQPQAEDIVLELDPGMAFGTGTHPTTSLCLEMMEEVVRAGQRVYDLGTGSGILAIAAAKLGAMVEAVDLDPVAVQVAGENVRLNGVERAVKVHRGDLGNVLAGKADLVIANIIADVIIGLLTGLPGLLRQDGELIASGIIDNRAAEVKAAMKNAGLRLLEEREDSGWVLLRAGWADAPV